MPQDVTAAPVHPLVILFQRGAVFMNLKEDASLLRDWINQWADDQSEVDDPDTCDLEERKVILAARNILAAVPVEGEHVAFLRWNGHTWSTCDQDSDGAFPVFRVPCPG